MSKASTRPVVEEDLDDLDDVLTDFNKPAAPSTPGPSKASAQAPLVPPNTAAKRKPTIDDEDFGVDFARELSKGMSQLMRDIAAETARGEGADEGAPLTEAEKKREEEFKKAWEAMLVEGMNGALDYDAELKKEPSKEESGASEAPPVEDTFQASIRKAMEKLKVEENKEGPKFGEDDDDADPLEKLLAHIGDGGAESEDDLQGLLEGMMTQLMSKDVLYDPLKELHEKFPAYLKDNDATLKEEDKTRYVEQQKIVAEIVEIYEDPKYTPENPDMGIKVVTLMNNMQNYGSPPPEIMGPLPPGLDLGPDGLPKLPDNCSIQ